MDRPPEPARRIVVVGGTSGIGLATAARLAGSGQALHLTLVGREAARGESARSRLARAHPQVSMHFVQADAADAPQATRAMEAAAQAMGGLDGLVSCAGGDVMPRLLGSIPCDEVMRELNAVAACVIVPACAAYARMRPQRRGAIVCVASDAAKVATPGESVVGAAMAAIAMFCRAMAIEARREGIRVNCVTPSIVRGTPLYARLQEDPFSSRLFGKAESMAGLGVADADDVAQAIAFLLGSGADRITGQTLSVNGGISAA